MASNMNANPIKQEVIVIDEETGAYNSKSNPETRKRNNAVAESNPKNVKVKIEESKPQDQDDKQKKQDNLKKEEGGDSHKPGFTMELKTHAAMGLRNALRSIKVPEIFQSHLEALPSQLEIHIKGQNGHLKSFLALKPSACTVFNCTQSYRLNLEFDRLLEAICNPAQDDEAIIRLSIGDRKLPLIIQSGTSNTTFEVEVQNSVGTPRDNKSIVYGTISISSGFFNTILQSMEEMLAYKASMGTQLVVDINNMDIDIKITSKAIDIIAVGVGYHLNPQEGHCDMLNVKDEEFHISFPLNELTNFIQASKTAENVTLYVYDKFSPALLFMSSTAKVYFYGKNIPRNI